MLLLLLTSMALSSRERKLGKILAEKTDKGFICTVRDLVCKGPWRRIRTYIAVHRYKRIFPEGALKGATTLHELKLLSKSDPVSIIRTEYIYHAFYTVAAETVSIFLLFILTVAGLLLASSFVPIFMLAYRYYEDLDANALGHSIVIIVVISLVFFAFFALAYYLYRKRRISITLLQKIQDRLNHIGN